MSESKDELRKKLKQKLNDKKLLRSNKECKDKIVNENLKKNGIEDVNKFKNDINGMKEYLKNNGVDIDSLLKNNNDINKILSTLTKK